MTKKKITAYVMHPGSTTSYDCGYDIDGKVVVEDGYYRIIGTNGLEYYLPIQYTRLIVQDLGKN